MKKITLLSLVAVLLTALTFTSCNTGDDNGYSLLTKEQQDAYQTKMAGSYLIWYSYSITRMMLTLRTKQIL